MRYLLSMLAVFAFTVSLQADVLLLEDFEDSTVNYTTSTPEFHDGSNDYFTIVPLNGPANSDSAYTGFGDSNFFAAEDMDDGGTRPSTGTISFNVNIAGFKNLNVGLLFAAGGNGNAVPSYDDEESFLVRAQIDGGAFQNLIAFEAEEPGGDITNNLIRRDTDFDGIGDGFTPSSAFLDYSNLAISGTGTNLLVEVIVTSNDDRSEFAFDNFQINGTVPEPSSGLFCILLMGVVGLKRRR